jgi:hypothetical protein
MAFPLALASFGADSYIAVQLKFGIPNCINVIYFCIEINIQNIDKGRKNLLI